MKSKYIKPQLAVEPLTVSNLLAGTYEDIRGGGTGIPSAKSSSFDFTEEENDEDY